MLDPTVQLGRNDIEELYWNNFFVKKKKKNYIFIFSDCFVEKFHC